MKQALVALMLLLTVAAGAIVAAPVQPAEASGHDGAISWIVDHDAKTITIRARLQIYPACSEDFHGCRVSQFVAEKVRAEILKVWNQGYTYLCYELIFEVDVKLGDNRFQIDDDRIGVGIDESPVPIRSWVTSGRSIRDITTSDNWQSNDPADRINPTNSWLAPTTWRRLPAPTRDENGMWRDLDAFNTTYAHEFGHLLGLHDTYRETDAGSEPIPGAPVDLMSSPRNKEVAQETIDRLVERNRDRLFDGDGNSVDLEDLECGYLIKAITVQETDIPALNPFRIEAEFEIAIEAVGNDTFEGDGSVNIEQSGGAVGTGACPGGLYAKAVRGVAQIVDNQLLLSFDFGPPVLPAACEDLMPWHPDAVALRRATVRRAIDAHERQRRGMGPFDPRNVRQRGRGLQVLRCAHRPRLPAECAPSHVPPREFPHLHVARRRVGCRPLGGALATGWWGRVTASGSSARRQRWACYQTTDYTR